MNFRSLLAVGALLAASASAFAVGGTAATGELVLGFGATGGTGSSQNLEVALGTAATYTALSDGQLHEIGRLSGADLAATYGADWNARADLNWGIIGFTGNALNNTIWASKKQSVVGTMGTPWAKMPASGGNTAGGVIKSVVSSLAAAPATANSSHSGVLEASTLQSWYTLQGTTGSAFKTPYETATFNNSTAIPAGGYVVSDLFQMVNTSAGQSSYVGSFGIDNTGGLWFSNDASDFAAIPEPSTYAMILGALTLGLVAVRRRMVKQA